jgi:hypothetical protein
MNETERSNLQMGLLSNRNKSLRGWLKVNAGLFNGHEPILSRLKENSARFKFKGVTKEISLFIDEGGQVVVSVGHLGACVDLIFEVDVSPRMTSGGRYYCEICKVPSRKYYTSLDTLLIQHCGLPLVRWARENFQESKRLLMVDTGGMSFAKILNREDVQKNKRTKKDKLYRVVPVVIPQREARRKHS